MSAEKGIAKTNETFQSAFAAGDAAKLSSLYTDDGWLMAPHVDTFKGKEAVQAAFQGMFDGGITRLTLTTDEIDQCGDTAIETGEFALYAGDVKIDNGKFMVVWKNIDGDWYLRRDIINSNQPMTE